MSAKPKHSPAEGQLYPAFVPGVRFLALVAFAISAYLAWVSLAGGGVAGCGPDSGCDKVLGTRWSKWFGVPVSLGALGVYAAIFGMTFKFGRKVPAAAQRQAWSVLVLAAVLVLGAALWFVGLQIAVIRAFCPYCMAAHTCGFILALLILLNAPFRKAPEKPWQVEKTVFVPPALGRKLALAAGAGLAMMVAGQVLHQPKTFKVQTIAPATVSTTALLSATANTQSLQRPPASATNASSSSTQAVQKPPPVTPPPPAIPANPLLTNLAAGRVLQIYNGAFQFPLDEVPLMGPPDAPHVMLSLFDYSCHFCRTVHWQLLQAHRLLSNQLAIVSLPMPLNPNCNHTVKRTHPDHVNACEYARLGLAVWRANRSKMEEFENWVFAPEKPVAPETVRQYAGLLVGTNELAKALQDPWISQLVQTTVNLYATNSTHYGRGNMPQLIIGTNIVEGTVLPQNLYQLLSANFGLKVPGQ